MSYRRFLLVLVLAIFDIIVYGAVVNMWLDYSKQQKSNTEQAVMIGKGVYHITSTKQPGDSVEVLEIESTGNNGCDIRCSGDTKILVVQQGKGDKSIEPVSLWTCIGLSLIGVGIGTLVLLWIIEVLVEPRTKEDGKGTGEIWSDPVWNVVWTLIAMAGIGIMIIIAAA